MGSRPTYSCFEFASPQVSDPAKGLAQVFACFKQAARELGVPPPLGSLTMGMIKPDGKAPKLRAKAAESRHCLPIFAKYWRMDQSR
jgi:hypothetical protein